MGCLLWRSPLTFVWPGVRHLANLKAIWGYFYQWDSNWLCCLSCQLRTIWSLHSSVQIKGTKCKYLKEMCSISIFNGYCLTPLLISFQIMLRHCCWLAMVEDKKGKMEKGPGQRDKLRGVHMKSLLVHQWTGIFLSTLYQM